MRSIAPVTGHLSPAEREHAGVRRERNRICAAKQKMLRAKKRIGMNAMVSSVPIARIDLTSSARQLQTNRSIMAIEPNS
jgi:hypothetical protein